MTNEEFQILAEKVFSGTATPAEQEQYNFEFQKLLHEDHNMEIQK